jgi:hypothetical protein
MSRGHLLSDDELQGTVEAFEAHGKRQRATARALGIDKTTLSNRLLRAAQRGLFGTKPVLPGFEIKRTTAEKDADGNIVKEFVTQVPERGDKFELPPGHIIKGVSAYTDPDGNVQAQWIKTRQDAATPHLVAALTETFKKYKGRARLAPRPRRVDHDLLSVYPIADQHNGLLAWGRETGEDYDITIAANRLRGCMGQLVAQAMPSRRAIVLNLGDWQHTDDQRNMTPRSGNLLDVDSRYFKILTAGVQLMIDCIELALQRHQSVLVRNIPGNHDPHASIALTVALKAFFSRNKRVTVDDDPSEFFFHRFGATLIGAHHGHRAEPDKLAMAMAVLRRAEWGATKFHYFYLGHIHHENAKEIGDVRVESFQTLAAKDAHSAANAYVSGQSLSCISLHRREGEIGRHRVNIVPPSMRNSK